MPKAVDLRQLTITHHPNARITEELPQTPDYLGAILAAPLTLIQEIIDALIQGFHGWPATRTGFKPGDLLRMGADIGIGLGALQTLAMRLERLEGDLAAALEDFGQYVQNALSLDPSKWLQNYLGFGGGLLGVLQGFATFQPAVDTFNKIATAISKVPVVSDIQKVSVVISKPITDAAASANTILARVDPSLPDGDQVFAKLTDATATIGYVKDGLTTVLGTVTNPLKNGSTYSLEAGVLADDGTPVPSTFRLLENTREVLKVTDAAIGTVTGSSIGEAFRSTGFGTIAPNSTARPGIVAAFAAFTK